jgi:hypothetical protein
MDDKTTEMRAIVKLVRPIAATMEHISLDGRITLLCAMLAQEICHLPVGERADELRRVVRELPDILDKTEIGMRAALVRNARAGL